MVVYMKGTRISIISDTHLLPEDFVANNQTFRRHMKTDRKLLAESEGLLNSALSMIHEKDSQIIFVTGDMTKDGEKASHELFNKKMLQFLKLKDGRRVFLIPGNHDINNKYAYNYNWEDRQVAKLIATVTPPEFMDIYRELIYDKAFNLYKDSEYFKEYLNKTNEKYDRKEIYKQYAHGYTSYASRVDLSPSKKGFEGLTIIGLDTNKYSIEMVIEKQDACQNTEGIITIEQLRWICDVAEQASERNDLIVLLAHHAFIPHFNNQEKSFAPYIIDNHADLIEDKDSRINGKTPADILADLGIKFIFTGHMHAQDISKKISPNNNPIYDIETGSTVTYPLPIRHLTLANNVTSDNPHVALKVETDLIHEFEYLGSEEKNYIRVEDALKHAGQDLITADLMEGIFAEYVLPNNKLKAKDFAEFVLKIDIEKTDFFNYICQKFLKEILKKEKKLTLRKKKTYKLYLSLLKNFETNSLDNAFILTIKSLGQTFSYKIKKGEFNYLIKDLLKQVDHNIINNHRLLLSWIKRLSDSFLKVQLKETGSIQTISDLSNKSYLAHILGDEKPDQDFIDILEDLSGKNIIKIAFFSMKKDLQNAIDDLLNHIRYDGLIEKYLIRFTDNNKFFGGAVDRRIYKFFGSSIADFLKNLKIKPSDIFGYAMANEQINKLSLEQSEDLLDLAYDLSTEEQLEYKDFAYFEDNNTYIEEKLTLHSNTKKDVNISKKSNGDSSHKLKQPKIKKKYLKSNIAFQALMYADIVTIGSLLMLYLSSRYMS